MPLTPARQARSRQAVGWGTISTPLRVTARTAFSRPRRRSSSARTAPARLTLPRRLTTCPVALRLSLAPRTRSARPLAVLPASRAPSSACCQAWPSTPGWADGAIAPPACSPCRICRAPGHLCALTVVGPSLTFPSLRIQSATRSASGSPACHATRHCVDRTATPSSRARGQAVEPSCSRSDHSLCTSSPLRRPALSSP